MTPSLQRKEKLQAVFRVASGNFLEMYDFMAAAIGFLSAWMSRRNTLTSAVVKA